MLAPISRVGACKVKFTSVASGTSDLVFLLTFSGVSVTSDFAFLGVEAAEDAFFLVGVAVFAAFFIGLTAALWLSVSAISMIEVEIMLQTGYYFEVLSISV